MASALVSVMAAGAGQRLKDVTDATGKPKILLRLLGETVLERFLRDLGSNTSQLPVTVRVYSLDKHTAEIRATANGSANIRLEVHAAIGVGTSAALHEIIDGVQEGPGVLVLYSDTILPFGAVSQMLSVALESDLRPEILVATCPLGTRSTDVTVVLAAGPKRYIKHLSKDRERPTAKGSENPEQVRAFAGAVFLSWSAVVAARRNRSTSESASQVISELCQLVSPADAFDVDWSININTRADYAEALEALARERRAWLSHP